MPQIRRVFLLMFLMFLLAAAAAADPTPHTTLRSLLAHTMADPVTVPPEWEGIWSVADSTYDCLGTLKGTSGPADDTLCTGAQITPPDQGFSYTCTGTATATTYDLTCTGDNEVFPDCTAHFTLVTHGTRTGDSYFAIATITSTFSGTGTGCDLLPPQCTQVNTHGTRTGPAPAAYCSTPVTPATWGQVKIHYR